jgi:pimeloyl-ACP methyl ester carboxylesterase
MIQSMTSSIAVKTRRGRVHVEVLGAGRPVLLVHGIPGSGAGWLQVAQLLSDRYMTVVPDLLGFGASIKPERLEDLHAVAQAEALLDVIDQLGLDTPAVIGHDFGGPIAVTLFARRPETFVALGLLATNTWTDTPIPFPLSLTTLPVVGGALGRVLFSGPALTGMLRSATGEPRIRLDAETHLGNAAQQRAIRTIFQGSLRHLNELYAPIQRTLSTIDVPTHVGWGEQDPFFPVDLGRRTAAAIPLARFSLYGGAGHFLPEERPTEVATDIAQLLGAPSNERQGSPPVSPASVRHQTR